MHEDFKFSLNQETIKIDLNQKQSDYFNELVMDLKELGQLQHR